MIVAGVQALRETIHHPSSSQPPSPPKAPPPAVEVLAPDDRRSRTSRPSSPEVLDQVVICRPNAGRKILTSSSVMKPSWLLPDQVGPSHRPTSVRPPVIKHGIFLLTSRPQGYGLHYPIRHGQIENWVCRRHHHHHHHNHDPDRRRGTLTGRDRITWSGFGPTPSLNIFASNPKITTFF